MQTKTKGILGVIFGILGILLIPIIFGPLAIFFGYKARKEGNTKMGVAGIVLGIVSLVLILVLLFIPRDRLFSVTPQTVFAVASQSMEHDGKDFEDWWQTQESWYLDNGITKADFLEFPYRRGIYKGDILNVDETTIDDLNIGDIIIFKLSRPEPLVARITREYEEDGVKYVSTKMDMNPMPIQTYSIDETKIGEDKIIGKVSERIPKVGWLKIFLAGIGIFR